MFLKQINCQYNITGQGLIQILHISNRFSYHQQVLKDNELMTSVYTKLISRDPEQFWTSGQWMTERKGGTDVGE